MSRRPPIEYTPKKGQMKRAFKKTMAATKRFRFPLILAVLMNIGSVFIAVYAPFVLKDLTDTISYHALAGVEIPMDQVGVKAMTLAILYLSNAIATFLSSFLMTTIANRYAQSLRKQIGEKINRIPLRYFDSHQIGDVMSRLTNDVDTISQSLSDSLGSFIHAVLLLLGVIFAMLFTSPAMTLAVVASLPLLLVLIALMAKLARPQFRKRSKVLGEINAAAEENYSGALIVKLFTAEKQTQESFEATNKKLGRALFLSEAYFGMLNPAMNFVSYLAYAAVCLTGGLLIASEQPGITIGTIAAFMVYVNLFQSPLSQISQSMNQLQSAAAASERVHEFLEEDELESEEGKERKILVDGNALKGEVVFDHIRFGYDETREIIHDFSAIAKPGSKIAIVGPTGAGKTTMVNLLMRFYEVNGGSILIDGVSTKEMKREEIHDIFGMVLQDSFVFHGTLRENLVYNTPNVSDEDLWAAIKASHLTHYVKTLPNGLDYVIEDSSAISAGEKQLISICRAMIRKAPLLILDEATSNVDTRTEERIQDAMDALTAGRTSFVIAHRLSTIRNADLILAMDKGNIVEQGTHESLMEKNGFYAEIYNAQFVMGGNEEES